MKRFTNVNNSQGVISLFSGLKSRITTYLPRIYYVITPMLFVLYGLFGVNESAWGKAQTFYSKCIVVAQPSQGGDVYVAKSKQAEGGFTFKDAQDESSQSGSSGGLTWTASSKTFDYYGYQQTAAGYTFKGWSTSSSATSGDTSTETDWLGNGTYPYHTFTISASSTNSSKPTTVTYYAIFTPNPYTVKFNGNGNTDGSMSDQGFTYDVAQNLTANSFTKKGYTFAGWATSSNGNVVYSNGQSVKNLAVSGEVTLYAKWTANTYEVVFNGNGSTSGSMSNQTFTYDAAKQALTANSYGRQYTVSYDAGEEGTTAALQTSNTTATYTFVNWNTQADGKGTAYLNTQSVSNIATSGTLNLYAQWKSDFVYLPTATKEVGVLDAWYLGEERIGKAGDSYTPTADVELTAHWINKYTPKFGGSDHSMEVGDQWANGFTFENTSSPTAHISNTSVISYNASTNTITALSEGSATIYFTQAETNTILPGTSATWTITVSRKDNTLALTSTSATKYVEEEVEGIITTKNSNATVQTSSTASTIAYYDIKDNKIVIPNSEAKSFVDTTITIEIWQEENVTYKASGKKKFTLTVKKYPTSFSGSDYNLMVDGTQVADYVYTNASAAQPTANSDDNFYYTIDEESLSTSVNKGSDVVTFNPANKQITACNAGTAKITLHQKETKKHTGATQEFNVAVHKYNSVFANMSTVNVKVEAKATSPYTLTYTKPDNSYISSESVVEGTPTTNSSDNYYYTLTHNVTSTNTSGSSDAKKAIEYAAGTKTVTGKNAGTATIHLYQKETYKYNAGDASFNVAVTKNANTIYVKGNANYSSSIYNDSYDNGLAITATNTDYANYPISVNQTAGTDVATYYSDQNAVYSSYKLGTATWSLSQPENYRYLAGSGSFSVTVAQQAEATDCYVLEALEEKSYGKYGNASNTQWQEFSWTGTPDKLKFKMWKYSNYNDIGNHIYVYDASGNQIKEFEYSISSMSTSARDYEEQLPSNARKIRIQNGGGSWASSSTLNTYVSNIYVTRKTWINASDLTIDKKSDNTPVYPGEKGVGTLTIDYSLANGGDLKITNDNPKFTLSKTTISNVDCKEGTATVTIEYVSATDGTDYAHLVIYNNVYRKEVTITGVTVKHTPTVTWSSNADYFNVDDELSATNANGLTVTLSSESNEDYVRCTDNSATMLAATSGTITITAHVEGNNIYYDADITKDITITNLEKQTITWDQDFSRLKTTDKTKSIVLNATASSGLPVSYELVGEKTGLSLTKSDGVWTLTYSEECKNTTIVAKQAGNVTTYAPASSVSKTLKVIDPTKVCDDNEVLVNSRISLTAENLLTPASVTYNIDIPASMTVSFSRIKDKNALGWDVTYLLGIDVEFYSGRNGDGDVLYTQSYSADDINKSLSNSNIDLADYIHAKSVKITTYATNGYYIDAVSYAHRKYCNISTDNLDFSTYPNTQTAALNLNVDYANYPITVECSNPKFSYDPTSFGDCSEYGTQSVSVSYTAGAEEGNDVGYLYIKDNTGATLKTCTLNVTISKVAQSITNTNIQTIYVTTDKVTLTAEANSGLTDFTYSASPEGIASFNGAEMTFVKEGTIAITVNQAGSNVYRPTSTTVQNVVVNKATPDIATNPTGTSIVYQQTLENSTLSGGAAETTLRGVANTPVAGTFAWTNPSQQIMDNAGSHNYSVTFTPTDGNMYNTKEFTIPITITRAEQSITMNDGAVKVAVEGIDAGAADSKIDLDELIQSSEVVNEIERTGSVSYEVISENKGNTTIGVGNVFSATAVGDYTIRATKAETDYYSEATADFTVTVGKRANTLTLANTEYAQYVDEEVAGVRQQQNSDAQVKTSSTSPTVAYYDVDNNKIVIPNNGTNEEQMFGSQKTVTITIWQEATERFEASGVKTITLTVKKYETAITGTDCVVKVNSTKTADYAFSNTITPVPSSNLGDDFYYTIDEPNFENEALNNGEGLITFNPATKEITGHNAGTTKITFFHKETRKHAGASLMCNIAVEKKENVIANTWNVWQKALGESATTSVSFTSTHGDYANYPIAINQISGEEVAVLNGTAASASVTTNTTKGYAIWHLSQAENYEYYAAEADLMVTVGVPAPPTCYVYEDNSEHKFSTAITDAEGRFETPIAINSPIDKIWYSAKRQTGGFNYFVVQYSTDNGKTWSAVSSPDLGTSYADYSASFPAMSGNKKITHVRFGAKTGATLSKWYKNVRISRKAYLTIQDAEQTTISSLPTMQCTIDETSTAEAKFYIDYSTCANEILIASSNPEHFTVSRTKIDLAGNCDDFNSPKEEITVTYNSAELGTHSGVITIRTEYQTRVLSVSGETTKRTPTITWQEGYTNNPLTLPIGLTVNATKPAAVSSNEAAIIYESSNENVVQIIENGYAFRVIGLGSATLTAVVPESDKWKSVSETRIINATEKTVQEIVWDQSFPRFMAQGDVIDLDAKVYLRQLSTNSLSYSAERTPYITYSCPVNNGIVSINGDKMTILDKYGEVKVKASVSGNADYEAAVPVTILINVRQPSAGCETPLVVNRTDIIDMFEVNVDFSDYTNLTTQEMISDEIAINHANGKPDKLSFSYGGEEFALGLIKFFGGAIKFEQFVNSQWIAVANSRVETEKNAWNTKSDLQLDENATALRIIREAGSTGHHKLQDIQVTRKQYLRATETEIDLGEIVKGETKSVQVGFDYSDIKGDLTARTINETTDLTIKDNGVIDLACGSFGHYDLPVTFTPNQEGEWTGTVEVYDNIADLRITVELRATVTIPANDEIIFNKEGDWSNEENWTLYVPEGGDIIIAQNQTVNISGSAQSITINEGVTVTVKKDVTLQIGNGTPKDRETYGNLYVEDGGTVLLEEGATLKVTNFFLEASLGGNGEKASSGQVAKCPDSLKVSGEAYFQLKLNPKGENDTAVWYDFVVPFEVDITTGISIVDNEGKIHPARYGKDYIVMRYDEAKRAVNGKDWIKYNGSMTPGKVYTIAVDADHPEWNTVRFKKKGTTLGAPATYQAECSTTGADKDCGWNGLGNGTLQHMQLSEASVRMIQVYDPEPNIFDTYYSDEVSAMKFAVGSSFFMQVGKDEDKNILFEQATEGHEFLAANAPERRSVEEFRLALTAEDAEYASDRLLISASEEATDEYMVGHDLLKMGTLTESKKARIWATKGGDKLCAVEATLTAQKATAPISIFTPSEGQYTLSIDKAPANATLYLTYNGRVIWNLSYNPYTFDLTEGTTEGYGLRLYMQQTPSVTTGVDEVQNDQAQCSKVLIEDKMYIITPQGAMYDATGKKIQ